MGDQPATYTCIGYDLGRAKDLGYTCKPRTPNPKIASPQPRIIRVQVEGG